MNPSQKCVLKISINSLADTGTEKPTPLTDGCNNRMVQLSPLD